MRRSVFLPGPAGGVAGGDLPYHGVECLVQVDPLGVREADHHEQDVGELHREGPFGLANSFFVFSPKRWLISRASSPTSSVSRARLVSGEKYPSLYWPIQRSTVC